MTLAAITGMKKIPIGNANRYGMATIAALGNVTLDATNESVHMIGYFSWEDGGTHTVNTTGSSAIEWRTGASTFANAGTTVKVGIAAVDTATGPVGRAVNVADAVTF